MPSKTRSSLKRALLLLLSAVLAIASFTCSSFVIQARPNTRHSSSSLLYATQSSSLQSKSKNIADFEYQELRAQLQAMERQGVVSRDLGQEKRDELEAYVKAVINQRPSPVKVSDIGRVLPDSTWKLVYSTQDAVLGDLPKDATVVLAFDENAEATKKLDYILEFGKKTLGLNRLVAKSSYQVDEGPVNPGLLTFTYDEIKTDVFGLQNLGVGFFGLLKGRANYVETVYMDGRFWMERGYSPEGNPYYNVYLKLEKQEQEEK